jgi:hypothetical protein
MEKIIDINYEMALDYELNYLLEIKHKDKTKQKIPLEYRVEDGPKQSKSYAPLPNELSLRKYQLFDHKCRSNYPQIQQNSM